MKRLLQIAIAATVLAAALASCSGKDRVIPKGTMEKIYYDMFMADQWLAIHPEARPQADTSWFYEPIFEKYGYTHQDYLNSVNFYLNDPERYAEMMRRVTSRLESDFNRLTGEAEKEREARNAALQSGGETDDGDSDFSMGSILAFFEENFPVGGEFKFTLPEEVFPYYGPARTLSDTLKAEVSDSLDAVLSDADSLAVRAAGKDRKEKIELEEDSGAVTEELIF